MNVPNKITVCRIILSIFLLILMVFPLNKIGVSFPEIKISADFHIKYCYFSKKCYKIRIVSKIEKN